MAYDIYCLTLSYYRLVSIVSLSDCLSSHLLGMLVTAVSPAGLPLALIGRVVWAVLHFNPHTFEKVSFGPFLILGLDKCRWGPRRWHKHELDWKYKLA